MRISCILPTYNRPDFLLTAIKSFKNQTYINKELIIIDDSPQIQNIHSDKYVRYIYIPKKMSIGTKRNLAIKYSKGDIICFWDDDDYNHKTRLQKQYNTLVSNKRYLINCFDNCIYYYQNTNTLKRLSKQNHQVLWKFGILSPTLFFYKRILDTTKTKMFTNSNTSEEHKFLKYIIKQFSFSSISFTKNNGEFIYNVHNSNSSLSAP